MATRIMAAVRKDGGTDVIQRPLTADEQKRLDGLMGDDAPGTDTAPVSRARQKLLTQARAAKKKPVERVEIDGEAYFIRRANNGKLATVSAWMGRDENCNLDTNDEPHERADKFTAAVLFVLVENEDETSFFGSDTDDADELKAAWRETLEIVRSIDEDTMELVGQLLGYCVIVNPRLDIKEDEPTPEEKKALAEAEKKSDNDEPPSAANGTPPTTSAPSTLNATPSTAAPVTWQSDVGCSTSTSLAIREPSNA